MSPPSNMAAKTTAMTTPANAGAGGGSYAARSAAVPNSTATTTAATATSAATATPSDKHRARRQRRGAVPHQYERFGCRRWRRRRFVCGPVGASASSSHVSNPAATASSRRRNATAGGFHAEHGARHQRRCGGSHQHDRFGIVRVPVHLRPLAAARLRRVRRKPMMPHSSSSSSSNQCHRHPAWR